jgi:hypothetical protein
MADEATPDTNSNAPESIVDLPEGVSLPEAQPESGDQPPEQATPDSPSNDSNPDAPETPPGDEPEQPNPDDNPNADANRPDPKEKARDEYRQRKSSVDDRAAAVIAEERRKLKELDPNDPDTRLDRLEANDNMRQAESYVREVRANQQALRNDNIAVRQDPDLAIFNPKSDVYNEDALTLAENEFARLYIHETDDENPEDREILGAFDPRTGQPVSYYTFMKQKAEEYEAIGKTAAQRGQAKEQEMRGNADPVGGAAPSKDKGGGSDMHNYLFGGK